MFDHPRGKIAKDPQINKYLSENSFVTTIRILPGTSHKYLISGAGDATIRVWEYMQGREVQTFNIREALGMPPAETDAEDDVTVFSFAICPTKSHIAAVIEKYALPLFLIALVRSIFCTRRVL